MKGIDIKEVSQPEDLKTKSEQHAVVKQAKFHKSIHLQPGQTYWELDTENGKITPAEYEEVNYAIGDGVHKKFLLKPNCLHVAAINKKNAEKKFKKMLLEIFR